MHAEHADPDHDEDDDDVVAAICTNWDIPLSSPHLAIPESLRAHPSTWTGPILSALRRLSDITQGQRGRAHSLLETYASARMRGEGRGRRQYDRHGNRSESGRGEGGRLEVSDVEYAVESLERISRGRAVEGDLGKWGGSGESRWEERRESLAAVKRKWGDGDGREGRKRKYVDEDEEDEDEGDVDVHPTWTSRPPVHHRNSSRSSSVSRDFSHDRHRWRHSYSVAESYHPRHHSYYAGHHPPLFHHVGQGFRQPLPSSSRSFSRTTEEARGMYGRPRFRHSIAAPIVHRSPTHFPPVKLPELKIPQMDGRVKAPALVGKGQTVGAPMVTIRGDVGQEKEGLQSKTGVGAATTDIENGNDGNIKEDVSDDGNGNEKGHSEMGMRIETDLKTPYSAFLNTLPTPAPGTAFSASSTRLPPLSALLAKPSGSPASSRFPARVVEVSKEERDSVQSAEVELRLRKAELEEEEARLEVAKREVEVRVRRVAVARAEADEVERKMKGVGAMDDDGRKKRAGSVEW